MTGFQPKDKRGYFMLPQSPDDSGYYVYGTPSDGAGQYAHPALLSVLLFVEREWQFVDNRKFGIGNISLAGGPKFPKHGTHKNGLQVDVRAIRTDGKRKGVDRSEEKEYDQAATAKLIALFFSHPSVVTILFNDPKIPGVRPWVDHDDHFHVAIRAEPKK